MQVRAYGKVNWMLCVLKKREDGYHELDMLMQKISLYDELSIEKSASGFDLKLNRDLGCSLSENLIYRAWALLQEKYRLKEGVSVSLIKNIPVAAGLGGGSSDAASFIEAVNHLFGLSMTPLEKMNLGAQLGMDVPFFLNCGLQHGIGRGEILTPLGAVQTGRFFILTPKVKVSTRKIYGGLEKADYQHRNHAEVLKALQERNYETLQKMTTNDLEKPLFRLFPQVLAFKERLLKEVRPSFCMVSGSGPSIILVSKGLEKISALRQSYGEEADIFEVEGVNE